jgi:hypothetical protein
MSHSIHAISVLTCNVLLACRCNFIAICSHVLACFGHIAMSIENLRSTASLLHCTFLVGTLNSHDGLIFPFTVSVFPIFVCPAIQLTVWRPPPQTFKSVVTQIWLFFSSTAQFPPTFEFEFFFSTAYRATSQVGQKDWQKVTRRRLHLRISLLQVITKTVSIMPRESKPRKNSHSRLNQDSPEWPQWPWEQMIGTWGSKQDRRKRFEVFGWIILDCDHLTCFVAPWCASVHHVLSLIHILPTYHSI